MADVRFTKSHEWIAVEGGIGTVGITSYAAGQLGDVVFVDLPPPGKHSAFGGGSRGSRKRQGSERDLCPGRRRPSPRSMRGLAGDPASVVNADPEGKGWFFRMKITNCGGAERPS